MPVFVYTARDGSGNQTSGTVEAESGSGAVSSLRERGLWVTELKESGSFRREVPAAPLAPPRGIESGQDKSLAKRVFAPVPVKDLSIFYRQLYTLLNSGVGIFQALEMLATPGQTSNPELRKIVQAIGAHVLRGGRFSEVMHRYPWLFDKMQVRMVEAGEAGGMLVDIFRRLADYLEHEWELRQDIKRKTLYPKLVFGLLLLVLPITMPLSVEGYLRGLGQIVLTAIGIGAPLFLFNRVFLTSVSGREFYDQVKLAFPVVGPLARKLAAARFARTLASLYGAGVPIASAVGLAGESSGNHLLEQHSARSVAAIERGLSLAQVLGGSHFFPPMFTGMVHTGETSGNLDTMLEKAADYYDSESRHATTQLVVALGVALLIIVAICVGFKVVSFYTGMFNGVIQNLGGGNGE